MEPGDTAPKFSLPGTDGTEIEEYRLEDFTDSGVVILLFYPFDFSPICTAELCNIRDAEFFELTPEVDVFGVSTESVYAHREFIQRYDLPFPLLSDNRGTVSEQYGLQYDEFEQHEAVSKRAIVVINVTETVEYTWSAADAREEFNIDILDELQREVDWFPAQPDD